MTDNTTGLPKVKVSGSEGSNFFEFSTQNTTAIPLLFELVELFKKIHITIQKVFSKAGRTFLIFTLPEGIFFSEDTSRTLNALVGNVDFEIVL